MQYSAIIATLAAAVAAQGSVFVDNFCSFDVFLASTADGQPGSGTLQLPANTQNAYNEVQRPVGVTNNAISISRTIDLANDIQFVYNPNANGLDYYSLSTKFGDPFKAEGFEALATGANTQQIICPPRDDGAGDCPNTYSPSNPNGDNPLASFPQGNNDNFIIRLCDSTG